MSIFSERLKQLRTEKEENQIDIAKMLGVSVQSYSAYEASREPKYEFLCKLASHFDVSTDYLLGITSAKSPQDQTIVSDLGISGDAIQNIKDCNRACWNVNAFISSRFFTSLIRHVTAFWRLDDVEFMNDKNNSIGISFHESIDRKSREKLLLSDINEIVSFILEEK